MRALSLSRCLVAIPLRLREQRVSLGGIFDQMAGQGPGLLMFLAALVSTIPTPGLPVGVLFGSVLAFLAVQEMVGIRPPKLPARFEKMSVSRDALRGLIRRMLPATRKIEGWSHPRLGFLTHPGIRPLLAGLIAIQGLLIALPIPFGNTLPGFAAALLALAWLTRDGAAVVLGVVLAVVWKGILAAAAFGAFSLI